MNIILAVEKGMVTQSYAMLWLVAYTFLLRVPSEALPIARGSAEAFWEGQAMLYLEGKDTLVLRLKNRKNKPRGSTLRRKCICESDTRTCPIHVLWHKFLEPMERGSQPWAEITGGMARSQLRETLQELGIPNAFAYGTQDFRRGHAKDLQLAGATFPQILAAGEWKGRAVATYVDLDSLERDLALEAAMQSDEEDCDWID